jgi:hypothetical protein
MWRWESLRFIPTTFHCGRGMYHINLHILPLSLILRKKRKNSKLSTFIIHTSRHSISCLIELHFYKLDIQSPFSQFWKGIKKTLIIDMEIVFEMLYLSKKKEEEVNLWLKLEFYGVCASGEKNMQLCLGWKGVFVFVFN